MPDRDKPKSKRPKFDDKESIAALERGEITPAAKHRIQEQLSRGDSFFSSDLSVREFLLCRETGIIPISQVMGVSSLVVSWTGSALGASVNSSSSFGSGYGSTGELTDISKAQSDSRHLALDRMRQEATLLGASGVIGVRVDATRPDMNQRTARFIAYGTAVRLPGYKATEPFLSDLNAQDFWQLYKSGYLPKGVVMGICCYYIYTDWLTGSQASSSFLYSTNQEIDKYTHYFTEARQLATSRLETELALLRADGCVGMTIDYEVEPIEIESNNRRRRDLVVHFSALGTAIERQNETLALPVPSRLFCIDLRKNKEQPGVDL